MPLQKIAFRASERFERVLLGLGNFTLFCGVAFDRFSKLWKRRELFLRQCEFIGVQSFMIVSVAGFFMGGVLGYQLFLSLHLFGAEALMGGTVGVSVFRELGPALASIMVTGNAGAAMAAELSSMRISEQIDALDVMGVDPMEYLVMPRVAAGLVMVPILSVYFAVIASIAASLVGCGVMGLSFPIYWQNFAEVSDKLDLIHCLVKGSSFGLVLTWIGCYYGFHARGGAKAVGFATRNTVVVSCLTILFVDYLLTALLPFSLKEFIVN